MNSDDMKALRVQADETRNGLATLLHHHEQLTIAFNSLIDTLQRIDSEEGQRKAAATVDLLVFSGVLDKAEHEAFLQGCEERRQKDADDKRRRRQVFESMGDRTQQVIRYKDMGKSTAEIASLLNIGQNTVAAHQRRYYRAIEAALNTSVNDIK